MWGLVALLLPQKLLICELGDIRAIRRPWADYSTKRVQFIYPVDRARDHDSITEAGLGAERKERKEGVRGAHTRTEGRQSFPLQWEVHNLSRQRCQQSRSNYRYKEIEEGESSNSLTTWAKCKVLNLLVRNAETKFGRQSLSHHFMYHFTKEECFVKIVKENGEENCSQKTTYTSKGPDVTLRKTGFTALRHK